MEGPTSKKRKPERVRRGVAPGYEPVVQPGKVVRIDDKRTEHGRDREPAVLRATPAARGLDGGEIDEETAEERRRRAAAEFRARVAGGEYRGLFDHRLGEIMAQAGRDRGLADEIGALRVALARLLAEEEDAGKLALGIARIT